MGLVLGAHHRERVSECPSSDKKYLLRSPAENLWDHNLDNRSRNRPEMPKSARSFSSHVLKERGFEANHAFLKQVDVV